MIGHCLRGSKPLLINVGRHAVDKNGKLYCSRSRGWLKMSRGLQAGTAKSSPFFSMAHAMRAFLAATATTAFQ